MKITTEIADKIITKLVTCGKKDILDHTPIYLQEINYKKDVTEIVVSANPEDTVFRSHLVFELQKIADCEIKIVVIGNEKEHQAWNMRKIVDEFRRSYDAYPSEEERELLVRQLVKDLSKWTIA